MRPDDHRTDRAMPGSGTEFSRDEWIVAIADHGVDPTDMPGRVVGTDGRDSLARRRKGAHRKTSPKRNNDSFSFRDLLIWCVVPFVAVLLVRIFLIGFYVIPSGSMRDTIGSATGSSRRSSRRDISISNAAISSCSTTPRTG